VWALRHACDGASGPERRLRRTSIPHGGEEDRYQSPCGSGNHLYGRANVSIAVETRQGYQNLCRLITRMKLRAKKGEGAATPQELAEFARGLVCISSDADERLVETFGRSNVFAELRRHRNREQEARNQSTVERARRLGIPLVATNGVSYATAKQRTARCVHVHSQPHDTGRRAKARGFGSFVD